eukprot:4347040-Pleurochrysis_carterae.AAC.1
MAGTVSQSQRFPTCTMLSMMLNVAAFCAAIIMGARQFWGSGAQDYASTRTAAVLTALVVLISTTLLLRTGTDSQPRASSHRTQADRRRRPPLRSLRCPRPTRWLIL